ncbi:MAG: glycosyltransferase family 2 protein [Candidatus Jordarchaeales archaeon]
MNSGSKVSVIVITHNGKRNLEECFVSLEKQSYRTFDVYLLDNASTDGSSDYVARNFPWVKILRFDKNYGFAEGYNKAIDIVKSEYIALLNDDTVVDPKWLEELVKAICEDEKVFAVGSKIFFRDEPDIIQSAGLKATRVGLGIDMHFGEKDDPSLREKFIGVCGAAMLLRREIFRKLGGFDENYFAFLEDLDLCWRAWLSGYKTLLVPTSIVYHKYGGSWGKRMTPKRTYFSQKNSLCNIVKNFEVGNLVLGLILYFIYAMVLLTLFLTRKQKENIYSLLRGMKDAFKELKTTLKKRKIVQAARVVPDKFLFNHGLIAEISESIREFLRLKI